MLEGECVKPIKWEDNLAMDVRKAFTALSEIIKDFSDVRILYESIQKQLKECMPEKDSNETAELILQCLVFYPSFQTIFSKWKPKENLFKLMHDLASFCIQQNVFKDCASFNEMHSSIAGMIKECHSEDDRHSAIEKILETFYRAFSHIKSKNFGIVYTPIKAVDFIVQSVNDICLKEFGCTLMDESVSILDPFAGTGIFASRLVHLNAARPEVIRQKEILPLSAMAASALLQEQSDESNSVEVCDTFKRLYNAETEIQVIIGNPPYCSGRRSGNEAAELLMHDSINRRIAETYAAESTATLKRHLYDLYIKAFRWASDSISNGIIAFITGAGWLEGRAMDGMRKCILKEFSSVYIVNLRGNHRTSGLQCRKEGGNIFGYGSRTPIAITFLVKKNKTGSNPAKVWKCDAADFLTAKEKLDWLQECRTIDGMNMVELKDWNGLNAESIAYPYAATKKSNEHSVFNLYSLGVTTGRDAWCINFSKDAVQSRMQDSIEFYNSEVDRLKLLNPSSQMESDALISKDECRFSWDRRQREDAFRRRKYVFSPSCIRTTMYRPYVKMHMYFSSVMNNCVYRIPQIFPKGFRNRAICVYGSSMPIMVDCIPNLHLVNDARVLPFKFVPRNYEADAKTVFSFDNDESGFEAVDGISDWFLEQCQKRVKTDVSKEDIFHYVYGILHSKEWRRMLEKWNEPIPRVALPKSLEFFRAFSEAGRTLSEMHLNYEKQDPYQDIAIEGDLERCSVVKMQWRSSKTELQFNDSILLKNIPQKAFDYAVGNKSVLDWIVEKYALKQDVHSQIINDPNQWNNGRYILELLLKLVNVSVKTMEIVDSLPSIDI